MLVFENWKKILVLTISIFAIIFSLPNFLSKELTNNSLSFLKSGEIRLGLDLQGGSYLLLKVESESLQTDRLNSLADELRLAMRNSSPKIGYKNLKVSGAKLTFTLNNKEDSSSITNVLVNIDKEFILNVDDLNNVEVLMSEAKIKEISDMRYCSRLKLLEEGLMK